MDDDLEGIKCISRRRYNPYQDTDEFIDECPDFLKDIPEWHREYFKKSKLVYRREAKRYLQDTLISLMQINRVESVYSLCLALFPYPALHAERDSFKVILGDAVRLNNFKLHSGNANDRFLFTKKWFECLSERILLDDLEQAARCGWLYDYGFYVPIWRRYVEEKEARFQQDFTEYENHQGSFLPTKSDTQAINKRPSTLDKMQERLDIYNQVVEEMGAGTHKNVLLREAAKRAGCGIDSIKRALGEKD